MKDIININKNYSLIKFMYIIIILIIYFNILLKNKSRKILGFVLIHFK